MQVFSHDAADLYNALFSKHHFTSFFQIPLTLCELWKRCCAVKVKFLPHYVAYHYFRSKGWVPKPGLLFGADFSR